MATVQEFDFSIDLLQVLLWQYNEAARLEKVVRSEQEWYAENQSKFWEDWVRDVFDLSTANDFGLAIWGRILAVPLVAQAPASGNRPVFGFGPHNRNFNHGTLGRDTSGVAGLTTEQKRLVLFLRYARLTSRGTVPEINAILKRVFGEYGPAHVLDGRDMTLTYVFGFVPPSSVRFVLENFDLLPRPAGVASEILVQPAEVFGFAPYYLNFNNGALAGS